MSTLGVQRKATTFYKIAATEMKITQHDARQLVKIYERFGKSALRPKLESSFSVGELSMLASKSDDAIKAAMRMKNANPFLRRTELERRLKLEGH
ncbi:hypothetical protein [Candidatus Burkholderia verschuerenii]|uniref:hypothetical protein n=1 Tax=Candidatus Burkholderia verschuerenii TaxID=242163 RepID=UPI00067DC8E1|nr:hypothetical protein [Candidatus Burkholderia verschuerenii]